jgi:hypothetical protein
MSHWHLAPGILKLKSKLLLDILGPELCIPKRGL